MVEHIGRYTHRVVLANARLLDIDGGKIRLVVKDYKSGGKKEVMTLPADEFIRRFLLHILPKSFRKIRYGGFLAPAIRDERLQQARHSLLIDARADLSAAIDSAFDDWTTHESEKCPRCSIGTLHAVDIANRQLLAMNVP